MTHNSLYKVEGDIDFYGELLKEDDGEAIVGDESGANKTCQITGMPLEENYVTLECSHRFNYISLYKEYCSQQQQQTVKTTRKISCPYCRNKQNFKPITDFGSTSITNPINEMNYKLCQHKYKYGTCNVICEHNIPDTTLYYCEFHYFDEAKQYNKVKKLAEKELKKKEKELKIAEKALKKKEKALNVVEKEPIIIGQYVPDEDGICNEPKVEPKTCQCILKTGPNKGQKCGNKTASDYGVCKRHDYSVLK